MKKRILAALLLAGLMLAATACNPGRSKYEIVTNEHGEAVTDEKGEIVTREIEDDKKDKNNGGGIKVEENEDPDGNWGELIPLN